MAYEQREKTGRGTLKKNESDNPNAPVLRGAVTVDGREHWIAVFRSKKEKGRFDVAFERKEPRPQQSYKQDEDRRTMAEDDFL